MVRKEYVVDEVVKMMNKVENIRNIAIVAHVDHGKCVSGDTRLVLTDGRVVAASELYSEIAKKGRAVKLEEAEKIYLADGIKVFSLNKEKAKIEQKPLTHAWKLRGGRTIRVLLRNGAQASTTPEHKYIALEGMGFAEKTAESLQVGDSIVCPKNLEVSSCMNIKETIMEKLATDSFYVRLKDESAAEIRSALKDIRANKLKAILGSTLSEDGLRFCLYKGRFRASDFAALCGFLGMPLSLGYDCVGTIFYRGGNPWNSKNSKSMRLPSDFGGLFFLTGLLFGDGSGDKLIVGKPELGKRFVEVLESFGIRPYFRDYGYRTPEIGAGSRTLLKLLGVLFDYPSSGKKSHSIKCSDFLFRAPSNLVAEFLRGYFDCDGTVESSRRAISITSASSRMLEDVQLLLLRFNCASILQGDTLYISGNSVKCFNEKVGFSLEEKIGKARALQEKVSGSYALDAIPLSKDAFSQMKGEASMESIHHSYYAYAGGKTMPSVKTMQKIAQKVGSGFLNNLCSEELAFIEIIGIEESREDEVYDFTVEDNHNFVAEGMFIHKTTMTDSLVARAGLISKELAGEQRVMDFDEQEQARGITIKAANISLALPLQRPGLPHQPDRHARARGLRRARDARNARGRRRSARCRLGRGHHAADGDSAPPGAQGEGKADGVHQQDRQADKRAAARRGRHAGAPHQNHKRPEQDHRAVRAGGQERRTGRSALQRATWRSAPRYHKWAVSVKSMNKFNIKFPDIYNHCKAGEHKILVEKSPLDEVLLEMVIEHLPNPKYGAAVPHPGHLERRPAVARGQGDACLRPEGQDHRRVLRRGERRARGRSGGGAAVLRDGEEERHAFPCIKAHDRKSAAVRNLHGPGPGHGGQRDCGEHRRHCRPARRIRRRNALRDQITPFEQIKHYSEPVVTKSIEAKDSKDLAKLIMALRQIGKEDPTLKVEINHETGEHLISGMGELHLEIIEYKITKERGIPIVTSPPIVVYREMISGKSGVIEGKSPNKHTKLKFIVEPVEKTVYDAMVEGKIPDGRPKGKSLVETLVECGMDRDEAKSVMDIHNKNILLNDTRGIQYLERDNGAR